MTADGIHFKGLTEVAQMIRNREITSVAVTEAILRRIDALDPRFQSYLHLCRDRALDQARRADAEIDKGIWKGPLHGVPLGIKDLCYTTFAPTTAGTTIHRGFAAPFNATVVDRLEAAGAVTLGKLTMTEGAYTSHHPDVPYPPNPWSADHWVGSSSTGSGVATSAGLCFGSLGSDTGGSIRFPSATCGLTGIKPTWGRVSRHGVFALADSLDHIGPMARSAADCAAILQAIAGWDANDPTTIDAPVPDYMAEVGKSIRDLRIGFDADYAFSGVDAEVCRALEQAIKVFETLGARIVEVKFPDYRDLVATWIMMCSVETAIAHEKTYHERAGDYGPDLARLIDEGRATTGLQTGHGLHKRLAFNGALAALFQSVDCMIIPTMPVPTPSLARMAEYGEDPSILNGILRFTAPFDFSGSPSITLPNGLDSAGLPLSLQLIGPHLAEAVLVRAGHAYQTATDWHRMQPPM